MKPQRFEIGQAVTPGKTGKMPSLHNTGQVRGGQIYHIKKYIEFGTHFPVWWVTTHELGDRHLIDETSLEPVISDSQLIELLSEEPQTVSQ